MEFPESLALTVRDYFKRRIITLLPFEISLADKIVLKPGILAIDISC